ncbi:MAG: 1-acyl-sn-glycerol-3-phosphate acyltransferase [Oceanococcus sp.]|nr:MAG: 1-acyl-sn-glycerol-3-phosphate acyltransferase [Oceanococcus sp.]
MPVATPAAQASASVKDIPLPRAVLRRLSIQQGFSWLSSPVWLPLLTLLGRYVLRWRLGDVGQLRKDYQVLRQRGPVMICANHLTMLDSALVALALGSPWWYWRNFSGFAWNVPERENFSSVRWKRWACYLLKCLPISRGSDRQSIALTLNQLSHLLNKGDSVLIFPEGGRSRSGRIDQENPAHGVGRILGQVPNCQVLCLYIRGEQQDSWSDLPTRGDRFRVLSRCIKPQTDARGLRASLDLSRQILNTLGELETQYFHDRQ